MLHEGRTIQNHLKKPNKKSNSTTSKQDHTAQTFAKLMFKGDVKAALHLISEQHKGEYLHLDSKVNSDSSNTTPCTVREALRLKHPPSQLAPANAIYSSADPPTVHPVLFESIDGALIRRAAPLATNVPTTNQPLHGRHQPLHGRHHPLLTRRYHTLALSMYAIGILPLIHQLKQNIKQVWYADDATATGRVCDLKQWWDQLENIGPNYSYVVNPTKTWLIVKETFLSEASEIFKNTHIRITTEGHLGAALGTQTYVDSYVGKKVNEFSEEVKRLSCIAKSQPYPAYSALTHGMASKRTYLTRTIFNTNHLIKPLEDAIRTYLIPALTGRAPPNDVERDLLSLPCRLGGIGMCNPSKTAAFEYSLSQRVTKPLCQLILQQDPTYSFETCEAQSQVKSEVHEERRKKQSVDASTLRSSLPPSLKFAMSLAQEKGASSWLTALPIVHAANHFQYHVFFLVLGEDIHPFGIMRFVILQHIS